jgi:hypothetical protein
MSRVIVVGDIHGCYDELMNLLDVMKYREGQDRLIFAGDLVDRGPESAKVVAWVREAQTRSNGLTTAIVGNHDEKYFRWYKHCLKQRTHPNYRIPMHPLSSEKSKIYASLSDEDLAFLGSLPIFLHLTDINWVVVHAGLEPAKSLENQDNGKMTHIRYVMPDTFKAVSLDSNMQPPSGSVYWTECYQLPFNVVYGHNVHSLSEPKIDTLSSGVQLVGLDTGCCFGGKLTAMVLPEVKGEPVTKANFFSVQAETAYVSRRRDND